MKRFLLKLLILTPLLINGCKQGPDCSAFKTGTFKMEYEGTTTLLVRDLKSQKEYFNGSKTPNTYTIEWVNECTYKIIPEESFFKTHPTKPRNAVVTVYITKTGDKTYKQVVKANYTSFVMETDVVKID